MGIYATAAATVIVIVIIVIIVIIVSIVGIVVVNTALVRIRKEPFPFGGSGVGNVGNSM